MATCILRIDGLSMNPRVGASHPVVFTSHIKKVFHTKTVGVHILVDLGVE